MVHYVCIGCVYVCQGYLAEHLHCVEVSSTDIASQVVHRLRLERLRTRKFKGKNLNYDKQIGISMIYSLTAEATVKKRLNTNYVSLITN